MSAIVLVMTDPYSAPDLIFLALLALLLPSSQSAVELVNYLTTSLLRAEILPKLDFSEGIPDDCITLVAVPTLLLNEEQVRRLVDDLEVRFLGNHDRNLHFVLLSDLPDSRQPSREDDPLIDLCAELIEGLNEKYGEQKYAEQGGGGSFLLLHRHRIYNPREGVWMGWERKRGKLLDLNKLLRQQYDSFPVKAGNLSVLPNARYVITLDSDTELPRGSAHRMVGTMAHPLNQAIIDPDSNIVVAGYGILQPRVGVSVQSAAASRLANIYSGQTGFDIYTRAVSDVYQDLYGEGSFAGKGIYEVDTVYQVLDRRFPRNALLSHDLIEGRVRSRGSGQRYRGHRRLSLALQRLQSPQASLVARRLADYCVAAFASAGRVGTTGAQSHRAGLAMEDFRQLAAEPGGTCNISSPGSRLAGIAGETCILDARDSRDSVCPGDGFDSSLS